MSASRYPRREETPKLSLLAQFDDMVRYSEHLTHGIEDEFITFVKGQLQIHSTHREELNEIDRLKRENFKFQEEKKKFENQCKHMKKTAEDEMEKRQKLEIKIKSLERQIELIKEVLLNDQNNLNDQTRALLNQQNLFQETSPKRLYPIEESMASLLSSSDLSFDKTDDFLEVEAFSKSRCFNSKKRRSDSNKNDSKKLKLQNNYEDDDDDVAFNSEENQNGNGNVNDDYAAVGPLTRSKRSFRELKGDSPTPPVPPKRIPNMDEEKAFPERHREEQYKETATRRSTGHMTRVHVFCTKTMIKPENCSSCGSLIRFCEQVLKCQDCKAICHHRCKNNVPLPCVPTVQTPKSRAALGNLADFTTSTAPMIPPLIVHCVKEIETRGLNEVGIYRVSGSEREVKDLKEKFLRGKTLPCLSKIDIHAVCGTIKEFLRSLNEPLITRSLWPEFILAAEMRSDSARLVAMQQAVSQMPQPNRDTLSFIILHLTSVSDSPACKMPVDNLEKVFGPTIVGYSAGDQHDVDLLKETRLQISVMHMLLKAPTSYWATILGIESSRNVPIITERKKELMLKSATPTRGSTFRTQGVTVHKVPLPPRATASMKTKRQYFNSPAFK